MNVKFLNPFVDAAYEVLLAETQFPMERGSLRLEKEPYITDEVTVIISLVGQVEGNVFYSMSHHVALTLASRIMGETFEQFSSLAQSGIAELGNVITGRASVKLAQSGYQATISPPALLEGKGATISTLDFARLIVPLSGKCGSVVIHLALRESTRRLVSTPNLPTPGKPLIE
jgi:chemotaxis protein CheX